MANREDDNRYGRGPQQDGGRYQGGRDERGFMDRAGDEVRSWFGDEEAESRRERDDRSWQREQGMTGRRDNQPFGREDRYQGRDDDDQNNAYAGYRGTAGGWGNQGGDSWNRDRPGSQGSYGAHGGSDYNREQGRQDRQNSFGGRQTMGRDHEGGGSQRYGQPTSRGGGSDNEQEVFGYGGAGGSSGFGGGPDHGRRFDRIDAGSTGTQGAHPMSAPTGGGYGTDAGPGGFGGGMGMGGGMGGSSAREAAIIRNAQQGGQGGQQRGQQGFGQQGGQHQGGQMQRGSRDHDPHYQQWRNQQIQSLDSDYDEYRREHQSRFEQDFGNWRSKRTEQRQSLSKVSEHMEVVGSDGQHIGTVDKVAGDRIILTKNDENAGGIHHSIPCGWIEKVEDKVTVSKTREEAMRQWRDEERNRALFEPENSGSPGPHVLNRSFSGTYED